MRRLALVLLLAGCEDFEQLRRAATCARDGNFCDGGAAGGAAGASAGGGTAGGAAGGSAGGGGGSTGGGAGGGSGSGFPTAPGDFATTDSGFFEPGWIVGRTGSGTIGLESTPYGFVWVYLDSSAGTMIETSPGAATRLTLPARSMTAREDLIGVAVNDGGSDAIEWLLNSTGTSFVDAGRSPNLSPVPAFALFRDAGAAMPLRAALFTGTDRRTTTSSATISWETHGIPTPRLDGTMVCNRGGYTRAVAAANELLYVTLVGGASPGCNVPLIDGGSSNAFNEPMLALMRGDGKFLTATILNSSGMPGYSVSNATVATGNGQVWTWERENFTMRVQRHDPLTLAASTSFTINNQSAASPLGALVVSSAGMFIIGMVAGSNWYSATQPIPWDGVSAQLFITQVSTAGAAIKTQTMRLPGYHPIAAAWANNQLVIAGNCLPGAQGPCSNTNVFVLGVTP